MTEHLCVLDGCVDVGRHKDDCDGGRCKGCLPRIAEDGQVCNTCRTRINADLTDIPDLVQQLEAEPDPVDHTTWTTRQLQWLPNPTTNPDRYPAWTPGPWTKQPGQELLAQLLPMGITTRVHGAHVTGSRQPPTPLGANGINRVDLTAEARNGSIDVIYRGHHSQTGGDPDQVGHLSVATELDFWARDWITTRDQREHLPAPTVVLLASWLAIRLDWACKDHPGIEEFAAKLTRIRAALRATLGLNPGRKELCHGIACKSCDRAMLYRDAGYIQCGWCRMYYSDREYQDWIALLDADAKRRIKAGLLKKPDRTADRPERTDIEVHIDFPNWVQAT